MDRQRLRTGPGADEGSDGAMQCGLERSSWQSF
jgi:hypothetical protein